MSLLSKNALPAEVQRGCVFAEPFNSSLDVTLNDGTFFNTIPIQNGYADFRTASQGLRYVNTTNFNASNNFSVVIDVDTTFLSGAYQTLIGVRALGGTISWVLAFNNDASTTAKTLYYTNASSAVTSTATVTPGRHKIAFTKDSSNNLIFYVDGVKLGNTVTAGAVSATQSYYFVGISPTSTLYLNGLIYDIKVFNSVLTAQEILDYYNNATFTYLSKASCELPFTSATYDFTNKRFLDVSGKGNHYTLGDGSTSSTFPTKLATKGINFNGAQYLKRAYSANMNTDPLTVMAMLLTTNTANPSRISMSGGSGYSNFNHQFTLINDKTFAFEGRTPSSPLISSANAAPVNNIKTFAFTSKSGSTTLYSDGVSFGTGSFSLGTNNTVGQYIGQDSSLSANRWFIGNMYHYITFPIELTPLQLIDLTLNLKKQINSI